MKTFFLSAAFLALSFFGAFAQIQPLGGAYEAAFAECVTTTEHARISAMLTQNIAQLRQEGKLAFARNTASYGWPIRQADGFDYNAVYGISNYVDHDPAFSGQNNNFITDYNCGNRSYDLASGYNHTGTDIFLWPFKWEMMENNQVEVIAIEDGVIIGKDDGNNDKNCSFNSNPWNAVYLMHADGSIGWYGHLKKNSLTSKAIGQSVNKGEFLGYIGSSGSSTGPHLHLELYNEAGDLIDPFVGTCNPTVEESCWEEQKPYREPMLNTIMTHNTDPMFLDCPTTQQPTENTNRDNCFMQGEVIYYAAYFHDQEMNQVANYRVLRPNGSVYKSWSHASPETYNASYWYWWYQMPSFEPSGKWTFEVSFSGQTLTHEFTVGELEAPVIDGSVTSVPLATEIYSIPFLEGFEYSWSIEGGTIIAGENTNEVTIEWGEFEQGDLCVDIINQDGCLGSSCLSVQLNPVNIQQAEGLKRFSAFPNPVQDQIHLQLEWKEPITRLEISLINSLGQKVIKVYEGTASAGNWHLTQPVSHLPKGIYLINLKSGDQQISQKILIE